MGTRAKPNVTPAITLARKLKIPHTVHEYKHDPNSDSFGLEAAEKLKLPPEQVFKTLVVKKRLRTIIDLSARDHTTIHVSAGRRGMEIELSPDDLRKALGGTYAEISRDDAA